MTDLFSGIKESLSGNRKTIILPEGTDIRVLEAASRLQGEGLVKPVLLGNETEVKKPQLKQELIFRKYRYH